MRTTEFVERVARHGRLTSTAEAREATRATLGTLAELVSQQTAAHLAADLPYDLESWVAAARDDPRSGAFHDTEEFVDRICERLRGPLDAEDAEQRAHHVLTTLRDAVTTDAWAELVEELPRDLDRLLA